MTITHTAEGSAMAITLNGRLDTTTAPALEAFLKENLPNVTELTMDFGALEYISSAGLRVLLSTQKTMNRQGSLVLRNVNDEIQEIFDITGFSDILTIE